MLGEPQVGVDHTRPCSLAVPASVSHGGALTPPAHTIVDARIRSG
jgi:hypothetical protein